MPSLLNLQKDQHGFYRLSRNLVLFGVTVYAKKEYIDINTELALIKSEIQYTLDAEGSFVLKYPKGYKNISTTISRSHEQSGLFNISTIRNLGPHGTTHVSRAQNIGFNHAFIITIDLLTEDMNQMWSYWRHYGSKDDAPAIPMF